MNKSFYIPLDKEIVDSYTLALKIARDKWIDKDTVIVNCSPDYSSIVCQIVNHRLSIDNKHELYEQLYLEMPYPTMSQVWNRDTREYELFHKYLHEWINKLDKSCKYLFIDSATLRGKNFALLRTNAINKIDYKLASLYLEESSIITPDYYVEKFSAEKDGGLIFEWENPLNPNWNY